jgi:hypothetical protein
VSFDDFFTKGLRDAEQRVPLLRPIRPEEQQALLTIVRSSQTFRFIDIVVDRVTRACDRSVVLQGARALWTDTAPDQRRLAGGVGLIVAAAVHVGLIVWQERPPMWLWLILPAAAAAAGVLLISFSGVDREEHV